MLESAVAQKRSRKPEINARMIESARRGLEGGRGCMEAIPESTDVLPRKLTPSKRPEFPLKSFRG